jgi:hypothetical protein
MGDSPLWVAKPNANADAALKFQSREEECAQLAIFTARRSR